MSERSTTHASDTAVDVNYWRSLDQLENSDEFQQIVEREFPEGIADAPTDDVSRRSFLSAIAASVALAGLTSCRKPKTNILEFNKRPEGFHPGTPQLYATTLTRGPYGIGVLVKSSDGRPTKIEGNPEHPSSKGGSDARLQAELLQIYDPGRSRHARGPQTAAAHGAEPGTDHGGGGEHGGHGGAAANANEVYEAFYAAWEATTKQLSKGAGIHVLMEPTTSPALLGMMGKLKDAFAEVRFHAWQPIHRDTVLAGATAAFGTPVETHVDFSKTRVVASFDCDFLSVDGNNLRNAHEWAKTRREPKPDAQLSRLYVFESCYSTTGTAADHRFRMTAQDTTKAVLQLAAELGVGDGTDLGTALAAHKTTPSAVTIAAIAKDLRAAGGNCAVVVGPRQPAAAHAAAHAINAALGAVGKCVTYTAMPESLRKASVDSIRELKTAIDAGQVKVLVCLGTNPIYDAPAEFGMGKLLHERVETTIHLGLHDDETAQQSTWHFPMAHELEAWGDARAHDGTVSLRQPLIEPLFGGMSPLEFLAFLGMQPNYEQLAVSRDASYGLELLKEHWKTANGAASFDTFWRRSLHQGVIEDSQIATEPVTLAAAGVAAAVRTFQKVDGFEVLLRPCPKMWDGRYANNSWMQELPDPLTKLSWDNAALISQATASRLGVENGDLLSVRVGERALTIPAWTLPGHADGSLTIYLGWGRTLPATCTVACANDGKTTGFNGYALRTSEAQWTLTGATVTKATGKHLLVCTQEHGTMAGRALVREATASENRSEPRWAPKRSSLARAAELQGKTEADLAKSLWQERGYGEGDKAIDPKAGKSKYQWGMVIDLNACTGCSACMIACVAENNIPMVGKLQVATNREMFWIRTDRYFATPKDNPMVCAEDPQVATMPVPCMQCENAPCESVCPVAATTHSPDGLNDMVYNRCIGTRYCSNNCPYKVRRFNFFNYTRELADTKQLVFNPDVTVRSRGVMEKCTYCVQRINGGRIRAKTKGKKVGDGPDDEHVTPACAQACPSQAITFGNIIDTSTKVAQLRASDLNYGLLSELNTKPRTTYLGRVRNPNPELNPELQSR
jgi:molybdopterin-containing oxidoreductase family iron-sulfur binding subunit